MKYKAVIILILGFLFNGCGKSIDNHSSHNTGETKKTTESSKTDAPPIARVSNPSGETPKDMVFIKGGTFKMGSDHGMPFEAPVHDVTLNSFWMDKHEVTVAECAKFVEETGYGY